jgi:predicted phosphodiesterase
MSIKVIHLADIHYSRERKDLVISSLKQVEETAKKNAVDLITIAGDLFDSATLNSANTGFPEFLDAIKGLADQAPLAIIYGTPSHDVDSSLDVFPKITTKYNITILEPGQAYFLYGEEGVFSENDAYRYFENREKSALILGVPEPRKKFLLANQTTSKDESEETIR